MKAGVTTSVVAHAALLVLAVVGLGAAQPLEPEVVESIAVDLVPISEVTNIRMGSLDSTVVETDTPALVETETPAELAQPTGNTQEDQPTPQATDRETPAPVMNTAPEPEPEPVAEPEPTPEEAPPPEPEAPPPEPEPAPEEAAPPEEVAAPTPEPAEPERAAAPMPRLPPAAILLAPAPKKPAPPVKTAEVKPPAQKPAEAPKPQPAPSKPANDQAKAADQVANLINNETSRGATTGQGGSPTLGKDTGRASTLSQSQIDGLIAQIKNCPYYNPPLGAADAGVTAMLSFSINGAGAVVGTPQILSGGGSQLERALASAAQRGVMRCGPYAMATNQDVRATFDPRLM